jgi:hypothetical protein
MPAISLALPVSKNDDDDDDVCGCVCVCVVWQVSYGRYFTDALHSAGMPSPRSTSLSLVTTLSPSLSPAPSKARLQGLRTPRLRFRAPALLQTDDVDQHLGAHSCCIAWRWSPCHGRRERRTMTTTLSLGARAHRTRCCSTPASSWARHCAWTLVRTSFACITRARWAWRCARVLT